MSNIPTYPLAKSIQTTTNTILFMHSFGGLSPPNE
jgi:hypothetical protein